MKHFTLVIAFLGCSKPEPATLSAVHAVDGDTAVGLFRTSDDAYSLGLIDSKGAVKWRARVPGDPYAIGPYQGITLVGDVVAVRYGHRAGYSTSDHAVVGYSLRDGRQLWDTTIAKYQPKDLGNYGTSSPGLPSYISSLAIDGKLALFTDTGAGHRFDVIDPATGKIVSTQPISDDVAYAPAVIGTRLFTHDVNQTTGYDVTGKPILHLQTSYEGCVIGDEYVVVERPKDGDVTPELVAYKNGDPTSRRVIASPFRPTSQPLINVRRCGRYRDRMVFLVQGSDLRATESTTVVVTDAAGQPLHAIDLGHDMLWNGPGSGANEHPLQSPLAGELPRFVPYTQTTYARDESQRVQRMVMLDLETGRIAWAGPQDDRVIHMTIYRSGTRWFTFYPTGPWTLTAYDGATGEPTASKRLHVYDGVGEVRPYHAAADRIWIYGGTKGREPTIGLLDLRTLEPVFAHGIEIKELLAETKKDLGRP